MFTQYMAETMKRDALAAGMIGRRRFVITLRRQCNLAPHVRQSMEKSPVLRNRQRGSQQQGRKRLLDLESEHGFDKYICSVKALWPRLAGLAR